MKVDVKKIDTIKRELRFEVSKERVSQKMEEVYQELGKVAKIKGFRQGKVPRHILESEHGKVANEETIRKLIPEVYQEALTQENLVPVDAPEIQDVSLKEGVMTFTAKLDLKPEVKIKDYKGIKVQRKDSKVTDEDINKTLEFFKKGQGQDKDKEVTIDDAFARGMGYPNLEDFKKALSRQLELDKDRQNRLDVENQIVENLLKKTKFVVPQSIVQKQLEHRLNQQREHLKSHGMSEDEIKKKQDEAKQALDGQVERDVKVFFILEAIAQLENIKVNEGESLPAKVIEFLLKEAKWSPA